MTLDSIRLQSFRSYKDESFEFEPGVNIIVGANASGKTNLLEAILVICRGNSFRAQDRDMIRFNDPWARLEAHLPDQKRTVNIVRHWEEAVQKEFDIAGRKLKRLLLAKQLPAVLFEPNHLRLLQGPPELRREYFDSLLSQLIPGYGQMLRDYKRSVAQRNALLKQGHGAESSLFAWNIRLSEIGGKIAAERISLLQKINAQLNSLYQKLAGSKSTAVRLDYYTPCKIDDYPSSLLKQLELRAPADLERGYTSVGPHRDDILVTFNGHLAAEAASRGETRTTLLALKIIELGLLEESQNQKPLVLLDDVFSELDGARRRALTEAIKGYQTFITTTDADVVVQHFMDRCNIIPL